MTKGNKNFDSKTKKNSVEGIGIETDSDLFDTLDRYPGDSVNEHKAIEEANEFFAEKQIGQVNNNS